MIRLLARAAACTLVVASAALSTACGPFARALLAGTARDGQQDCQEAVATCEDLVVTTCDRAEACGTMAFDDCIEHLIEGSLPCERAFEADDFDECLDDLELTRCEDLRDGQMPLSCNDPVVHFSDDDICR